MVLSSDDVETIRQYADKLEKWAEILSYNLSPTENLWTELSLSLYPQDVQGIASRLADIPAAGQNIRKELEEFSKLVQAVDAWRYQGVYPEDLGEFCARINRLMKATRNIISILRTLSDPGETESRSECSVPSSQHAERRTQDQACRLAPDEHISKEALTAYKLHYEDRLNIQQIARRMTAELRLDKALRPWQISRWIKQVESRHKRTRIPIRSIAPRTSGTMKRSGNIDIAAQTEAKKT
jgi:hypothetical protein